MKTGRLRKDAGVLGLLLAGVTTLIGSGWLFAPMSAARDAGPLSILSWVIASGVIALISLIYAELGPMFPKSGGLVHMSLVSHGRLLGRVWSWILFLAYISIAPVEAMAVVTYAGSYIHGLVDPQTLLLTGAGTWAAVGVLAALAALNFMVLRLVLLFNSIATWVKILTPVGTIAVLLAFSHHPSNLAVHTGVEHGWVAMLTTVSTAGVFFSLFGFSQPIALAGEAKDPGRALPIVVLGTTAIGAAIFILLQYAFVTAVPPELLAGSGWHGLSFGGVAGPFAGLAVVIGASFWATVLYADAIISPAMCGYMWVTTTPRILYAMGEEGLWPRFFTRVSSHGVPWVGVLATFLIGTLFLLPFPSWQKLVAYASSATVLSYGIGPVVLLAMRRAAPGSPRPFRLPAAALMAPLAFIASNFVMFWAGCAALSFLLALIAATFTGYALYCLLRGAGPTELAEWRHSAWLLPYFAGMWLICYLSPVSMGGIGYLDIFEGMAAIILLSLLTLHLALKSTLPPAAVAESYRAVTRSTPGPEA
ncbi:MAG TPA: APC family permease [Gammaproteobacteria bacterium]|nr:APC family permease [Gammaproteobacteria bacterium]